MTAERLDALNRTGIPTVIRVSRLTEQTVLAIHVRPIDAASQ